MLRLFRLVLIWITAMAIPVQGMAAVTLLHCAPGHRQAQVPDAVHPGQAAHGHVSHHDRHDVSVAATAADLGAADMQRASEPAAAADAGALSHHAGHKCSACASCCPGVGVPSTAVTIAIPEHASEIIAAPLARAVGVVVIGGLERPPRVGLSA